MTENLEQQQTADIIAAAGQKEETVTAVTNGKGGAAADAPEQPDAATECQRLQRQVAELQDRMLRIQADAENFRKRINREKEEVIRYAKEEFIREILPLKDNLERALAHASEAERQDAIYAGVKMVLEQFNAVLEKMGVAPIEALNQPFDPAFHEAMLQQESDEVPPNTVICEHQKGYCYNERLLRPALVTVARAPAGE
jgi:molecular chaperone GrpE